MQSPSFHHTKKQRLRVAIAAALLMALLISSWLRISPVPRAEASDWFNGTYKFRKLITFDRGLVPTTQTNFPALVSFTHADLIQDTDCTVVVDGPCHASGWDIVFAESDHTPVQLDYEIEKYIPTTGEVVMWVRIPTLNGLGAASDTTIYMYYGKTGVVSSPENITGVWDSNFKGVWHLKETSGTQFDSTINNTDTTLISVTLQGIAAGKVNGADDFELDVPNFIRAGSSLNISSSYTLSAWITPETLPVGAHSIVDKRSGGASNYYMETSGNDLTAGGPNSACTTNTASLGVGTAQYVAAVFDDLADIITPYVNGVSSPSCAQVSSPTTNTAILTFGSSPNGTFDGIIDEIRISATPRTGDWITTEYNNMANQGCRTVPEGCTPVNATAFISALGSEEQNTGPAIPILAETSAFANWHTPDTTPLLGTFSSTDPQSDAIQYEVRWDDNPDCASPLGTETTGTFASGASASHQLVATLANGTYWWCVRARDPAGSNAWSAFSASRSFTVDTALSADAWLQTTSDQFTTILTDPDNILTDTEASIPGGVKVKGW